MIFMKMNFFDIFNFWRTFFPKLGPIFVSPALLWQFEIIFYEWFLSTVSAYLTPPKLLKNLFALYSFPTYLALTHTIVNSRFKFQIWQSNLSANTNLASDQKWVVFHISYQNYYQSQKIAKFWFSRSFFSIRN